MRWFQSIYERIVVLLSPEDTRGDGESGFVRDENRLNHNRKTSFGEFEIEHPKGVSTFDPNSERAKKGLAFQSKVFEELKSRFPENKTFEETWNYFKKQNPNLSIYELACLEKEYGDITFVLNGQRYWIECCYSMGTKSTWFCEMKRLKFKGQNKWYCWGKINEPGKVWYIHSRVWNRYVENCQIKRQGKKKFRVVPVHLVGDNIRNAIKGSEQFTDELQL